MSFALGFAFGLAAIFGIRRIHRSRAAAKLHGPILRLLGGGEEIAEGEIAYLLAVSLPIAIVALRGLEWLGRVEGRDGQSPAGPVGRCYRITGLDEKSLTRNRK